MTIPASNLAISTMDQQFRTLVLRNAARSIDGSCLGRMVGGVSIVTFSANCPFISAWHYVLVFTHDGLPFYESWWQPPEALVLLLRGKTSDNAINVVGQSEVRCYIAQKFLLVW